MDATTLEANAAHAVDRAPGQRGELRGVPDAVWRKTAGIETPTREDLASVDRKRKNKASNDDWVNPHDPDARITKMKDGRTHLAHKAEHAVDLETGAVVAVTVQPGDAGGHREHAGDAGGCRVHGDGDGGASGPSGCRRGRSRR